MIHVYSSISTLSGIPIYHAQNHETGWHSGVTTDIASLHLKYRANPDVKHWTLVAIVPSLPIDPSQYPELFI